MHIDKSMVKPDKDDAELYREMHKKIDSAGSVRDILDQVYQYNDIYLTKAVHDMELYQVGGESDGAAADAVDEFVARQADAGVIVDASAKTSANAAAANVGARATASDVAPMERLRGEIESANERFRAAVSSVDERIAQSKSARVTAQRETATVSDADESELVRRARENMHAAMSKMGSLDVESPAPATAETSAISAQQTSESHKHNMSATEMMFKKLEQIGGGDSVAESPSQIGGVPVSKGRKKLTDTQLRALAEMIANNGNASKTLDLLNKRRGYTAEFAPVNAKQETTSQVAAKPQESKQKSKQTERQTEKPTTKPVAKSVATAADAVKQASNAQSEIDPMSITFDSGWSPSRAQKQAASTSAPASATTPVLTTTPENYVPRHLKKSVEPIPAMPASHSDKTDDAGAFDEWISALPDIAYDFDDDDVNDAASVVMVSDEEQQFQLARENSLVRFFREKLRRSDTAAQLTGPIALGERNTVLDKISSTSGLLVVALCSCAIASIMLGAGIMGAYDNYVYDTPKAVYWQEGDTYDVPDGLLQPDNPVAADTIVNYIYDVPTVADAYASEANAVVGYEIFGAAQVARMDELVDEYGDVATAKQELGNVADESGIGDKVTKIDVHLPKEAQKYVEPQKAPVAPANNAPKK